MLKLEINEEFIKEFNENVKRITGVWYDLQGFKPYARSKYNKGCPLIEFPNLKCDDLEGFKIEANYVHLGDGNIYWSYEFLIEDRYESTIEETGESFMPQSWFNKSDDELREIFKPMLLKDLEKYKKECEEKIKNYKELLDSFSNKVERANEVLKKLKF